MAYNGLPYMGITADEKKLPYTLEMLFFENHNNIPSCDFTAVRCEKDPNGNLSIGRATHPLKDSNLPNCLKQAYKNRRWDHMESWINDQSPNTSRELLRITGVDTDQQKITWAATNYNTQAVTNLVMDMEINGQTLRMLTLRNRELPPLNHRYLANNLGISVLVFTHDGKPIIPLRSNDVAVFPSEWGCSASTAAALPSAEASSFSDLLNEPIRKMFGEELGQDSDFRKRIIPLALCREWFRGGKPQLFMALHSDLDLDTAKTRLRKAEHAQETADEKMAFWQKILTKFSKSNQQPEKILWDLKDTSIPFSIELLANLYFYQLYKSANHM